MFCDEIVISDAIVRRVNLEMTPFQPKFTGSYMTKNAFYSGKPTSTLELEIGTKNTRSTHV